VSIEGRRGDGMLDSMHAAKCNQVLRGLHASRFGGCEAQPCWSARIVVSRGTSCKLGSLGGTWGGAVLSLGVAFASLRVCGGPVAFGERADRWRSPVLIAGSFQAKSACGSRYRRPQQQGEWTKWQ
jgi:hypothetical protein